VVAVGLTFVGYGIACGHGIAGCPSDFSVFDQPGVAPLMLVSAGRVLFGVGLWVYAVCLEVRNLGEGGPTRPASLP
jgi:hypothetical protein